MNFIDVLISYKLTHYNMKDYDENNVLINYYSIKKNYDFIEYVYKNLLRLQLKDKIIFRENLKRLSILVSVDEIIILKYILNNANIYN